MEEHVLSSAVNAKLIKIIAVEHTEGEGTEGSPMVAMVSFFLDGYLIGKVEKNTLTFRRLGGK